MDPERWQQIQTLFLNALDVEASQRPDFIADACGDDSSLADEVHALLAAHTESGALEIEKTLRPSSPPDPGEDPLLGTHVGPHRLVRRLGQGGMGDVYLAERDDDSYRQQVAVKLVRPGIGSSGLTARFRTERQILARLGHPNIAPLLDGGVSDDGRPYLVMQYIAGSPLTDYSNHHRLTLNERLRLFLQVLEAVRFAHLHLIVHRDLKPSNILVTEDGEVKLLDFGIAKLLSPRDLDVSEALTQTHMRVMTPHYAAPEQFSGAAITTVTDVYALGVLLYELLTDRRPYGLSQRTPADMERLVCREMPRRPSAALGEPPEPSSGDRETHSMDLAAPSTHSVEVTSAARRTVPGRLRRQLRGDLDNIVMMALRKEPERRYASAEAFAEDIHRHLDGRPVAARPDTFAYRTGKFLRRHRLAVAGTGTAVVLIVAFAVTMAWQATQIAEHARQLERERDRVQRQAEKTAQVKTLVSDLFKVLDPDERQGNPADRLQRASQRIVEDLENQPELQAELMDEVVTIYINLGLYPAALEMAEDALARQRRTLPPQDPAVSKARLRLGETLFLSSRFAEAQVQYEAVLAMQRRTLGDDHLDVGRTLYVLSRLYRNSNLYAQASQSADEAWNILRSTLGDDHPETTDALLRKAVVASQTEGPEVAEELLHEVVRRQRRLLGDDHPKVAWALTTLVHQLHRQGRFAESEPLLAEALAIQRQRYGNDHPDLSRTQQVTAHLYASTGRLHEAEALSRQVLATRLQRLGPNHAASATAMARLGDILRARGAFAEAETLLLDALAVRRRLYGTGHRLLRENLQSLAQLYAAWQRPDQAETYRRQL